MAAEIVAHHPKALSLDNDGVLSWKITVQSGGIAQLLTGKAPKLPTIVEIPRLDRTVSQPKHSLKESPSSPTLQSRQAKD